VARLDRSVAALAGPTHVSHRNDAHPVFQYSVDRNSSESDYTQPQQNSGVFSAGQVGHVQSLQAISFLRMRVCLTSKITDCLHAAAVL